MTDLENPILKNIETGEIIQVVKSPFCIGRALECDYIIQNTIISRKHCTLTKTNSGWSLTDLSTNGSFINDQLFKGQTTLLKHNDSINIGLVYKFLTQPEPLSDLMSQSSFDEFGISDEYLLNLADNILEKVEKNNGVKEAHDVSNINNSVVVVPNNVLVCNQSNEVIIENVQHNEESAANVPNTIVSSTNDVSTSTSNIKEDDQNISHIASTIDYVVKKFSTELQSTSVAIYIPQNSINMDKTIQHSSSQPDNNITHTNRPSSSVTTAVISPMNSNKKMKISGKTPVLENVEKCLKDQNQFDDFEDEMMCSICANLFIKAVILNCSHSFCQYCIEMWKKKKSDCPICRKKLTQTIRNLVLDNFIEKMVENSSDEIKEQRKKALEERANLEEQIASKSKPSENTRQRRSNRNQNSRNQATTNNRHTRNTSRNTNQATRAFPEPSPQPTAVITILDSPSSTSDESDLDDDIDYWYYDDYEYNGRSGAYYGGYGRCYKCGDRGHWANGCPFM